ncbi:30642_t:CDS:2, partial [Gigaspora margarita]
VHLIQVGSDASRANNYMGSLIPTRNPYYPKSETSKIAKASEIAKTSKTRQN